jgi:predicted RNase H-like HicB family nuclease
MSTYTVQYERDEAGWWMASVLEVRGCRTQGRSIPQARERIRDALSLFVQDAATAELRDHVVLPSRIRTLIEKREAAMRRLEKLQKEESARLKLAAQKLVGELGLSTRDAGVVLHLSHQRVQQIVAQSAPKKAVARSAPTRGRRSTSAPSPKRQKSRAHSDPVS